MKRSAVVITVIVLTLRSMCDGQDVLRTIQLPKPDTTGGKPLMQTLKERRTTRSFSARKLPNQILSNLLWAAFGFNRPDGHRTAPSARNWQEINVYAVMEDGVYSYDAPSHSLKEIVAGDFRAKTGTQNFVATAPLDLVYVADLVKANTQSEEERTLYTGADCGFIAENVYLCCASEGLSVVVRASIDRRALALAMHLTGDQKILLSQTVGFPPE